ncbi:Cell division cycle 5-like protein [Camellia lanceoleosa]|uniref:Cell division cycle 5-like protein n=1 Tax=Camellia lanceoleosa TaxID=1840588 RepID=A0ACC0IES3_9ERIC|nr:Cell division cycle 5-like protein [Camellia lanceoleosa]
MEELHINEDVDMHESAKLEFHRQADLKRFFCSGLSTFHSPRMSTRLVIKPVPKDNEEPEEKIEEDMSGRIGREKAEEESIGKGENKEGVKPAADRKAVYVLVIKDFEEYELKEMRATKLWSQIEVTFKEMDTAGTELKCFQAYTKSRAAS